ncbi:hypothetical protein RJT34_15161 [Clitoria ternatea]|uniref:Uncharacterized protein n=1 Tax=Clitoria ternatea TaxID=43366 RepID=A0AAN9JRZ5_CLITE
MVGAWFYEDLFKAKNLIAAPMAQESLYHLFFGIRHYNVVFFLVAFTSYVPWPRDGTIFSRKDKTLEDEGYDQGKE